MARTGRVEFPGAIYHVMSRGVDGQPTFRDDVDRYGFLDLCGRLTAEGALAIHTFCLMTNHFHLICETPRGSLGRWMQKLLGRYTQCFNQRHSRTGHLWQQRYKPIIIEPGPYLLDCSAYVHLNPVRAEMVSQPGQYAWSSYRAYADGNCVVDWVTTGLATTLVGGADEYIKYVAAADFRHKHPLHQAERGMVLGSLGFRKAICGLIDERNIPKNSQAAKLVLPP